MSIFDNLKFVNPFSKPFSDNKKLEDDIARQLEKNSQGMSVTELDLNSMGFGSPNVGTGFSDFHTNVIDFDQVFNTKKQRVAKYREMSYYPEISEALDIVSDEAIVKDSEGKIVHLNITKEMPKRIEKIFLEEFKDVTENVLKVDESLHDLYKKWLTEGELFLEWILNSKKNRIIGYKILPCFTTFPVYEKSGRIKGFLQSAIDEKRNQEILVPMESNQLSYVHWGSVGKNRLDIRGYLESAVRPYNQLKSLEDSLIVYRLVRAPERRVWNIEVGRLPAQKAEQQIKRMIHKYKRKHTYDPATGAVDSARNVQSLAEDFWFAKREGQGTDITTLQSGMNLGELDDVKYFLSKMYKTLKLPKTRWSPDVQPSNYTTGRDLDREELKFNLFVQRTQERFKKIVKDCFVEQMKFKYKDDKRFSKYLKYNNFDIEFTQANYFKEIKDLELMETRLGILGSAITYVTNTDEPNNPLSMELVLKKYFQMNDEEYELNEKLKKKERDKNKEVQDVYGDEEGEEETGGEEPEEKDVPSNKEGGNAESPNGNPSGLGGGLGSPEKDKQNDMDKEESNEYIGKENIHVSKKVKDFLNKPKKKTKKIL